MYFIFILLCKYFLIVFRFFNLPVYSKVTFLKNKFKKFATNKTPPGFFSSFKYFVEITLLLFDFPEVSTNRKISIIGSPIISIFFF